MQQKRLTLISLVEHVKEMQQSDVYHVSNEDPS